MNFLSVTQQLISLDISFWRVKPPAHSAGLPGDVDTIAGSAFLPAPAYRQEGGASSRLARESFVFLG